jgi:murein DD-endopeptidase MepM/ murein hydrolase activator NlpD
MKHEVLSYTVEKGDSIFKISKQFDIKPETILWANPETLNDNPELLTIGMKLKIPATDGIYYQWKTGDTVAAVAARFKTEPSSILLWPENDLDLLDPIINPGSYVMVPGGKREMVSWVMPTIPRGKSGVSKALAGPGACETTDGAYGTGTFVWPAVNKSLSGNDYWSGHLALDIASNMGSPVFASDSGLVVYAGWNNTGYGNMIMIDHGNGYQTLYAHLSQISISCGSSVYQGSSIGASGSSGNSTGPHLHFETRYLSGLVNPWSLMP